MKQIKYIIYPGHIRSRHDGELHYISGSQLIKVYKVHRDECKIVMDNGDLVRVREQYPDAEILQPREDGNY